MLLLVLKIGGIPDDLCTLIPASPNTRISHPNLLHGSDESYVISTINCCKTLGTEIKGADAGMDGFMRCSNREAEDPDYTIKSSQFEKLRRNLKRPNFQEIHRLKMSAFGKTKVLPGGPWKRGKGEIQPVTGIHLLKPGRRKIGAIVSVLNEVSH